MTTYPDTVRYLYSLGNEIRTAKLGLDRIEALLARLDHPERAFGSVHVAGTNGKGSTCAMVESGLRTAGHRTGLYSSPHLIEPTERIQVAGAPISEDLFLRTFDTVHSVAEAMLQAEELDSHPTYFETVTAMAFVAFRELGVERAVIEVGLGGRLDATNVVTPELAVVTPVDYDHETFLGPSLRGIAREKAGILKPGVPAVFARQRHSVTRLLNQRAGELGIATVSTSDWKVENLRVDSRGSRFTARGPYNEIHVRCPLAGEHQVDNALTAAVVLGELGVSSGDTETGIRCAQWPGRLEVVSGAPEIVLDGAHNPAGMRALARHIQRFYSNRRVWIIYGAMRDKSLDEIAGTLSAVAEKIILTSANSHRALRQEAVGGFFDHPAVEVAASTEEALELVRQAAPEDAIFVTGSLMLVGEAKRLLAS
ncbi:MAG: bifunctional folylpolyglutamate synthase/dihydrofolate synthase [bacterium]|nr:bifunctional folylpolyglutamate synthase/dihydrofolate synthase [bacterium]